MKYSKPEVIRALEKHKQVIHHIQKSEIYYETTKSDYLKAFLGVISADIYLANGEAIRVFYETCLNSKTQGERYLTIFEVEPLFEMEFEELSFWERWGVKTKILMPERLKDDIFADREICTTTFEDQEYKVSIEDRQVVLDKVSIFGNQRIELDKENPQIFAVQASKGGITPSAMRRILNLEPQND